MIVLVDTDVLVDVALDRPGFAKDAGRLLDVLQERPHVGHVAWHSASNFYYLVKAAIGHIAATDFLAELLEFISVASTTTQDLQYAIRLGMKDFEDAMQVAAAIACRADLVVSRNCKDYRKAPLPAITPREAVTQLARKP